MLCIGYAKRGRGGLTAILSQAGTPPHPNLLPAGGEKEQRAARTKKWRGAVGMHCRVVIPGRAIGREPGIHSHSAAGFCLAICCNCRGYGFRLSLRSAGMTRECNASRGRSPHAGGEGAASGAIGEMARRMKKRRKGKSSRRGLFWKRRTPDEERAEREIAFAAIKRLYAESLPLWRVCKRGFCRRHKRCAAEGAACVPRAWKLMPPDVQERAYEEVTRGGPRRLPPATRLEQDLRRYPPTNFVLRN